MIKGNKTRSLEQFFGSQTLRWSTLGFLLTLIFSIPCIWYSSKVSSEKQVMVLARSATRAFRPMILQNNVRDAQFQMQRALELKPNESAIVLDQNFKPLYPINESDKSAKCTTVMSYCWTNGGLTLLYPIYFDDVRQENIFGYLQLTIQPSLDINSVAVFIFILISTFLGLAIGLSTTLKRSARQVGTTLTEWSEHLKNNPQAQAVTAAAPFSELIPMREAVDGLQIQIEKLKEETAKKTKADAQLSLLREISHDLKTPHSLLAKYFYLHLDTIKTKGQADVREVQNIESTLKRMGELLRQVRIIPSSNLHFLDDDTICDLLQETESVIKDLKTLPEVIEKSVKIEIQSALSSESKARISKLAFYRILENLVRNAVEAVAEDSGMISVELKEQGHQLQLVIKDNGCGIDPKIQKQIFDFDFTTKLSRGTGLGLGIVAKICKEFGAEVAFTSRLKIGTQFTVLFERAHSEEKLDQFAEASHG